MENHCSKNLMQFDDNLSEFDPLAHTTSARCEQVKVPTSGFETYSKELLGFDIVSSKESRPVQNLHADIFTPSSSSLVNTVKLPLKGLEQKPTPKSTSSAFYDSNAIKNELFTSSSSSSLQNKSISKSGSFTSYVFDSNKVQVQPKVQSRFYDSTIENKTSKKTPGTFFSYVDDQLNGTVQSKSSAKLNALQNGPSYTNKVGQQKEEILHLLMTKRQDDFTSRHPFRIFVGTWNVNGQSPPRDVYQWIATDPNPPDIYVIGFQELDLSKEAFVFSESSREEEWYQVIFNSLHPKGTYEFVKLIRLVGMMLLVFAAKRHAAHIKHVQSHQVGTGLLGKMGNKGGVGVRFNLYNTTICLVNSHLAAHAEMTQKRNEDYTDICTRMRFPAPNGQGYVSMFEHDVLIWLGDLNYRIDGMVPEMVKECIRMKHYKPLTENDQLLRQRRAGNAFHNFDEGELTFQPTYKYDPGTDLWDSSEKCRIPAWCDRVLWREAMPRNLSKKNPVKWMKLLAYRSHSALKISDHKPVSALFNVEVKVIDQERHRKVYAEEMRRLDQMENEWLPTMTISTHSIDFGSVRFQKSVVRSVELENTGPAYCNFEFIAKPGEPSYCKRWLDISKPKGFLLPGEKLNVEFEVYINKSTVVDLNSGKEKLEDILVLHLIGGKDFFITVNGNFLPTCFGLSIESLCRMKKPVREMAQNDILALSKITPLGSNKILLDFPVSPIPKELWQLIDHLHRNALREPFLFQQRGLHHDLHEIQEVLDTTLLPLGGYHNLPGSNHSVAEALLVLLEALPEPIIPFHLYLHCIELSNDCAGSKQLLKSMSTSHLNVFSYLISFLQELLTYQLYNGLSVAKLGNIFSGFFLRPVQPKAGIESRIERQKAKTFVENFLGTSLEDLVPT